MFFSTPKSILHSLLLVALIFGPSSPDWAQETSAPNTPLPDAPNPTSTVPGSKPTEYSLKDYSRPHTHFPNPIAPYTSQDVPPPNLSNTDRVQQLIHDG